MTEKSNSKTIERIEEIMAGFGWNQAELARQFNVQRNNVNRWLSGSVAPSGAVLRLIEIHEAWLSAMKKEGVNIRFLRK